MSVAERMLASGVERISNNPKPNQIQPFAAIIAVTTDWVITHISGNMGAFLDIDASVIGHTLDHVLLDEAVHDIRGVLNATAGQTGLGRLLGSDLRAGCGPFDLTVHVNDTGFLLEIEHSEAPSRMDDIGMIRGLIERIKQSSTLEDVAQKAARSIRALTGFDSVAVCQVDSQYICTTIAKAQILGTGPEDGAYALGDILPEAETPLISQIYMIANVDAPNVSVLSDAEQPSLDLSHAISGVPTPKCAAFLKTSGAKASFAVSIIGNGKLVGIILCHHKSPKRSGFRTRMLVGLFVDLFAYEFVAAASKA